MANPNIVGATAACHDVNQEFYGVKTPEIGYLCRESLLFSQISGLIGGPEGEYFCTYLKMNVLEDTRLPGSFLEISKGNKQAFTAVYQAYFNRIYSTVLHYCKLNHLAEDIVQQVFYILWEKRESLTEVENPEAWLWAVARNQALKRLKAEAGNKKYADYVKERFAEESYNPLNRLILKQKDEKIEQLLARLSPRQQEIYRLNKYSGITYAGIATQLGLSKETVKEHMANALSILRRLLVTYKDELVLLLVFLGA